ncbi:MAG: GNAT family N-acetyltransferase [Erysipelotrichaceae bacterium]
MLVLANKNDQNRILQYLNNNHLINIFIIGDILNYGFDQSFQKVYYEVKDDNICAVGLVFYQNFIVYSNEDYDYEAMYQCYLSNGCQLLMGNEFSVSCLLDHFDTGKYFIKRQTFSVLVTKQRLHFDPTVKIAHCDDVDDIIASHKSIEEFKDLYNDKLKELIVNRITSKEGKHYIIKKDNMVIAHANTAACTTNSCIVGGVFTMPSYRNNGYASTVLESLCSDMIDSGITPCLFYDNKKAESIYLKLGFKPMDNWLIIGEKR